MSKCRICRVNFQDPENYGVCVDCRDRLLKELLEESTFNNGIEQVKSRLVSLGYQVTVSADRDNCAVVYHAVYDGSSSLGQSDDSDDQKYEKQIRRHREELEQINAKVSNEKRWIISCMHHTCNERGYRLDIRMELRMTLAEYLKKYSLTIRNVLQLGQDLCTQLSYRSCPHNNINLNQIFVNPCCQEIANNTELNQGDLGKSFFILEDTEVPYPKNDVAYNRAPELAVGVPLSKLTDMYAIGMTMYTLLRNNDPGEFAVNDRAGITLNGSMFNGINNRITTEIRKMIALYPQDRYQSYEEICSVLKGLLEDEKKLDDVATEGAQTAKTVKKRKERDKQKKPRKPLDPELLRKISVAVISVVIVAAIGFLASVLFNQSPESQIKDQINSGAYLSAYDAISDLHETGVNVDQLVVHFVSACMDAKDYSRAVSALPLLSDAECENIAYFRNVFDRIIEAGQGRFLKQTMVNMKGRYSALDSMFESYIREYPDIFG